jgi:hypothetical protein
MRQKKKKPIPAAFLPTSHTEVDKRAGAFSISEGCRRLDPAQMCSASFNSKLMPSHLPRAALSQVNLRARATPHELFVTDELSEPDNVM